MRRKALQIGDVDACDDRASREIRDRDHEGVHGEIRTRIDAAEQLSGADAGSCVHRMDLDALAPKPSEHTSVSCSPSNNLREHCRHGSNRSIASTHLRYQRTYAIASRRRTVPDRGDRFTIQQQHQPARRARRAGRVAPDSQRSTICAAHSRVSGGIGPCVRSSSASHSSTAARCRSRTKWAPTASSTAAERLRAPTSSRSPRRRTVSSVSVTFSLAMAA